MKIITVNECTVGDKNITVLVSRAPKRRYRQIIKAYYRMRN